MIQGANHITFAVRRLDRAFAFYRDVLCCAPIARWSSGAYLQAGGLWIALIHDPSRLPASGADYSHFAFSVSAADFPTLRDRLIAAGAGEWSQNTSEGASHYFRDPDGHQLEIHVGDVQSRLREMRENPWEKITFFD